MIETDSTETVLAGGDQVSDYFTGTQFEKTGLTQGTDYQFKYRAYNR